MRQQTPPKRLALFYLLDAIFKHSSRSEFDGYSHIILENLFLICNLVMKNLTFERLWMPKAKT